MRNTATLRWLASWFFGVLLVSCAFACIAVAQRTAGGRGSRAESTEGVCSTNPVVNSTADSGPGTLRDAIAAACVGSTITFNFLPPGAGAPSAAQQIALLSPLIIAKTLTIQGPGAALLTVTRTVATQFRIFIVTTGTVTISGMTVSNGRATTSGSGGGIDVENTGPTPPVIRLDGVRVTANGTTGSGGGIAINSPVVGHLIFNCTIDNNTASQGAGLLVGGFGTSQAQLTIANSTFSNNSATAEGGAIDSFATVSLKNVTVVGNSAPSPQGGSGIALQSGSALRLRSSIVAANVRQGATLGAGSVDIRARSGSGIFSDGYNILGRNDEFEGPTAAFPTGAPNANNDYVGTAAAPVDPLLGPLADNGGQTPTRAVLAGSPASDQGSAVAGITADQRGMTRPVDLSVPNAPGGDGSDIGAYEAQISTASTVSISGRVLTAEGRGLTNAQVTIVGPGGDSRSVVTGRNGRFEFDDVEVGVTYILTVNARRFAYVPRILAVTDAIGDIVFSPDGSPLIAK